MALCVAGNLNGFTSGRLQSRQIIFPVLHKRHDTILSSVPMSPHPVRMHTIAWRALRTTYRGHRYSACRTVAGVRHSLSRNFHRSTVAHQIPRDPADPTNNVATDGTNNFHEAAGQPLADDGAVAGLGKTPELTSTSFRANRRRDYGSGVQRAKRNRQSPEVPPLILPDWFWENNVRLCSEPTRGGSRLYIYGFDYWIDQASRVNEEIIELEQSVKSTADYSSSNGYERLISALEKIWNLVGEVTGATDMILQLLRTPGPIHNERNAEELVSLSGVNVRPDKTYHLHLDVYEEVLASIKADLLLPFPGNDVKDVIRPDTLLLCPETMMSGFLDEIIGQVAADLEADIIRLDVEDIAQIFSQHFGENIGWTKSPTALMGYESSKRTNGLDVPEKGAPLDKESDDLGESEQSLPVVSLGNFNARNIRSPLEAAFTILQGPSKPSHAQDLSKGMSIVNFLGQAANSASPATQPFLVDETWIDHKLGSTLESVVCAADTKRARRASAATNELGPQVNPPVNRRLVIQINDYKTLKDHDIGSRVLKKLREAVNRRCSEGCKTVIVGAASQDYAEHGWIWARDWIRSISSDALSNLQKTILIPPRRRAGQLARFTFDRMTRVRNLNIRHVEEMIRQLLSVGNGSSTVVDLKRGLSLTESHKNHTDHHIWTHNRARKIAVAILGSRDSSQVYDGQAFLRALSTLGRAEAVKKEWVAKEDEDRQMMDNILEQDANSVPPANSPTQEKIERIRRSCTSYEKKLLGGVIDPSDLKTTFADVQAPAETIEALKTLTTLSLSRPESFSYGVLATDKIPGILMYGPPGSGKTLLAKAVAKESGASVLEVSASEMNDKYVGEGEKNVKALFSLAKKLSPCVVFIDEADALLGARQSDKHRSHRELINQFLREWDGMGDLSAFIMVATNRPFDLDEAVLRRLPRRVLVDLPLERDREAILKIHLKGEVLDESISLSKIAKDTPFYSGSDLKNLSVAAALACVREENEVASKHTGDAPYAYPPRRVLTKKHFDKAMEEISASISEDMSTLSAIRKFDERYGDRKGRRKKRSAIGFGNATDQEKDSEAGRVRKMNMNV